MCVSDTLAAPQGGAPLRCAGPLLIVGLQTVNIMKYYCVRYIRIVIDYTLGLNGIGHRVTVQVKSGCGRLAGLGRLGHGRDRPYSGHTLACSGDRGATQERPYGLECSSTLAFFAARR